MARDALRESLVEQGWASRRGVRASAGSGKTYDLTGHYLRWLLLGAEPASMLATTFTRKAAGEILGRVLTRLAQACSSEERLTGLAAELAMPGITLSKARGHLVRLCLTLHRISISTIDSFFARLYSAFRHELGFPTDMRVVDSDSPEMARIRRDAVAAVLASEDQTELLDLLIDLQRGNASQGVASDLERRLKEVHEIFRTAPPAAWNAITPPAGLLALAALDEARRWLDEAYIHLRHNRQRDALAREIGLIIAEDWDALLEKGIAAKILAGSDSYYAPIPPDLISAYEPIVAHARAAVVARHVAHTRALFHLLSLYHDAYTALCVHDGIMAFGDVPLALSRLLSGRPAQEIGHRLDTAIDHLLLDEFQDTNPEQYAILKPFADGIHALSSEHGLIYCVGDLKQSIYGWRGATPQIFERFGIDLPDVVWSDNDISYRSSQIVLDSVNRLFGDLIGNAVLRERNPSAAELWQSRFHDHQAKKSLAGFVRLLQSPGVGDQSEDGTLPETDALTDDPHSEFCAKKVAEITQDAPRASVGVLMRTGEAVRRMIFLLSRLGIPASAEGGSPIVDDPAVGIVLSALAFADHPSDTAAQFHVLNSPLAEALSLAGQEALRVEEAALRIRRRLMEKGYAATIASWARTLSPSCNERGAHRLQQLVELADEHDRRPGSRPMDFVQFVHAQSVEEPQPAAVRVMTIHKAKGLEFDVVVLPELQMSLQRIPTLVYQRDPETLQITAVSSYPNRVTQSAEPRLAEMCEENSAQEVREALSLLYVAMTRARQALYIIVPSLRTKQDGTAEKARFSLANIVRAGLAGDTALTDLTLPEELYSHGDRGWFRCQPERPRPISPQAAKNAEPIVLDLADLPPRIWRRITPSSLAPEPEESEISDTARRRGLALHAVLAQVEWADSPLPPDNLLIQAARDTSPASSEDELTASLSALHAFAASPAFRQAFSRPKTAGSERVELWREREFVQLLDGDLVSGIFDRVIVIFDGDRAVRAQLLDFKTGDLSEADIQGLAEAYRAQVALYRKSLCAMTVLSLRDVDASILFTSWGKSIPL